MTYADTSFLASLYSTDHHSVSAASHVTAHRVSGFLWTEWHDLELRNAMRLRIFRNEITPQDRSIALNRVLLDLASSVLQRTRFEWHDVFREAESLSATHAETIGSRSLDILHVASAVVIGATEFLTFDKRQAALAKAAGLKVPKL